MIYISGPCVSTTHECYFMVVDLDLLTCDIVDTSATCSWASSPLGVIMALTEHRFHPFSLSFSATWLSPSSHRVTAKSYTDLRRMELERGKKCADARAEPRQKNTTNITSSGWYWLVDAHWKRCVDAWDLGVFTPCGAVVRSSSDLAWGLCMIVSGNCRRGTHWTQCE